MMTKEQKARLIDAYLNKVISRDDFNFLLKKGIVFPPIPWVYDDEEQSKEEERRKELSCKIFGMRILPKIEWVDGSEID